MLPLWIIDLRNKSNRRDYFQSLVGEIAHVYMAHSDESVSSKKTGSSEYASPFSALRVSADCDTSSSSLELGTETTLKEQLDAQDQQEANRNSIICGNYWRYSCLGDISYGFDFEHKKEDTLQDNCNQKCESAQNYIFKSDEIAEKIYEFQNDLVKEGQRFIKDLRKSNAHPDIKINVVILGDLTEIFTRVVFPAVASMLQKEKGRILPYHIHQGMEIVGMLFIPSDIHTREVNMRRDMQQTLKEIDVQHNLNNLRGYDHMMFYQDVQNRTECTYPLLNDQQLAEYLMQCLVHLYLACDESHPLLSGTSSADTFYISMGATSVYFDTENEDLKNSRRLMLDLIRNFKSGGDNENENQKMVLLDDDSYEPSGFFNNTILQRLACDDIEEENPNPHPIRQFLAKYLKRYYYHLYLRFFTVNMMKRIINKIDSSTHNILAAIANSSNKKLADAEKIIQDRLHFKIIPHLNANDGGIPMLVNLFKDMQEQLSQKRQGIQRILEQLYWRQIEEVHIDDVLQDKFMEYHSAYEVDIRNKNGGVNQLDMKKQAVTELNGILSKEATLLSCIGRSVLLGIMGALAFVPVLDFLSPHIIDLGPVRRYSEGWSVLLFLFPALIQLLCYFRYNRKKKRAVNNLKAIYLHDAYARVANRIESEINSFYDKLMKLASRYLNRCEVITKELGKNLPMDEQETFLFPQSLFNQPLIGGHFGNDVLLPENEVDDAEVRISYIRYKLKDIGKKEYFLLINQYKDAFYGLFRDVTLCENLLRRVNENGEEELVTKEQQEEEAEIAWESHLNQFYVDLKDIVRKSLIPRENATVGEKLWRYCTLNLDRVDVMKPMIAYAATNGEATSSADREFVDLKFNERRIENNLVAYLSTSNIQKQIDEYNHVFKKYIFVTRWRCFDHFNLNRILPTEDIDEKIHQQRVYEEFEQEKMYRPYVSSLLLWSLCPDDSSSLEWHKLFDSQFMDQAHKDKVIFRRKLNPND